MPPDPQKERSSKPYQGMSWPVRLIVYFLCGMVLMAIVALMLVKGKSGSLWWLLWIPPTLGLLGVLCPQAIDWLVARIDWLLRLRR